MIRPMTHKLYLFIFFIFLGASLEASEGITSCPTELPFLEKKESYSFEDQKSLICHIKEEIEKGYSKNIFKSFSEKRDQSLEECFALIKKENIFPNEFSAIGKECAAKFNDSHFQVNVATETSIQAPFIMTSYKNKIFVRAINLYENCQEELPLQVGDEILSINGDSPWTAIEKLEKLAAASSNMARLSDSLISFSSRNFAFPQSGELKVRFKRGGEIQEVDTHYGFISRNPESREVKDLEEKGFKNCSGQKSRTLEGFFLSHSLYDTEWSFHTNENYSPVAEFSERAGKNRDHCYLKINNFNDEDGVFIATGQKTEGNLYDHLSDVIQDCDQRGQSLILDLRTNPGGYHRLLKKFLALTLSYDKAKLPWLFNTQLIHENAGLAPCEATVFYEPTLPLNLDLFYGSFCHLSRNINSNSYHYKNSILVLTTENCMSSCDIASLYFKYAKQATLIGGATTGAFNGISNYKTNSDYNPDQALYIANTDMATFIQVPEASPVKDSFCSVYYPSFCLQALENEPVQPNFPYQTSPKDLDMNDLGSGWKEMIEKVSSLLPSTDLP